VKYAMKVLSPTEAWQNCGSTHRAISTQKRAITVRTISPYFAKVALTRSLFRGTSGECGYDDRNPRTSDV
jgi:hypothetical protein